MQLTVPDFICIGAQKAGTTWLYNQLIAHPRIAIPEKECNILTLPQAHLQAYNEFYEGQEAGRFLGDVSPYYATQPGTALRIAAMNPDCKIILLVRDPLARAFSQYRMATKAGRIPPETPLWTAFRQNLQFMQRRGCYLDLFGEFAQTGFDMSNILPLPFEWIAARPVDLLGKLDAFLGVEGLAQSSQIKSSFASATHGSSPPERDAARIRKWYAKRNAGLSTYLWWQPEWL